MGEGEGGIYLNVPTAQQLQSFHGWGQTSDWNVQTSQKRIGPRPFFGGVTRYCIRIIWFSFE